MSTSPDFFDKPRHGKRAALIIGAVLVVVVLVFGSIQLGRHLGKDDTTTDAEPSTANSSTSPGAVTSLTVIRGESIEKGVSVGYPHTLVGAVSAAVEYMAQVGSTLDEDRAGQIGQVVADPAWTTAAVDFASGVGGARQMVGIPVQGPVPDGASIVTAPVAYQLRNDTADQMTVYLQSYVTTVKDDADLQTHTAVYPLTMTWVDGDWKWLKPDGPFDVDDMHQDPGSPEAAAAGWIPLTR